MSVWRRKAMPALRRTERGLSRGRGRTRSSRIGCWRTPRRRSAELGYSESESLPDVVVAENTERVHHLVVCTLCSCYPTWLLGRPPDWYKSLTYRSRAVVDPRGVMREFGLELEPGVEVMVLDSTADVRYLVLPQRPEGTEGWSEEELARLVTRDSMVGVSGPLTPEPVLG